MRKILIKIDGAPRGIRTLAPGSGVLFYTERIIFKKYDLFGKTNSMTDLYVRLKGAKNGKVEQNMSEIAPQTAPLFNHKFD